MKRLMTVAAVFISWSFAEASAVKSTSVDDSDGVFDSRFTLSPDDSQVVNRPRRQLDLMCYTCMSKNIPDVTKAILSKTINMNESAQTDACNDPFDHLNATILGVMAEPCDTACMKVVSENRYLKIVLRGCLTTFYKRSSIDEFPLPMLMAAGGQFPNTCDRQRQTTETIGEITTDTCLCTKDFCNGVHSSFAISQGTLFVSLLVVAISVILH